MKNATARRPNLRVVPPAPPSPVAGLPHDPALRGFAVVYREGQANHCPGCGRSQWIIGRMSAGCAFCSCALPLADVRDVVSGRRG